MKKFLLLGLLGLACSYEANAMLSRAVRVVAPVAVAVGIARGTSYASDERLKVFRRSDEELRKFFQPCKEGDSTVCFFFFAQDKTDLDRFSKKEVENAAELNMQKCEKGQSYRYCEVASFLFEQLRLNKKAKLAYRKGVALAEKEEQLVLERCLAEKDPIKKFLQVDCRNALSEYYGKMELEARARLEMQEKMDEIEEWIDRATRA
jgi:hypothetical protein